MKVKEIWVPVKDFEGRYEVSNLGGVRSLDHETNNKWGKYIQKGKVLRQYPNKQGYLCVYLYRGSKKRKIMRVNRLVAINFIPNPDNKPWVNHINGVKDDNRVENLEWCTVAENVQHSFDHLGRVGGATGRFGALTANHRRVIQMDWDYNFIKEHESISTASREVGIPIQTIHWACNKGNDNAAKYNKYRWKYTQN